MSSEPGLELLAEADEFPLADIFFFYSPGMGCPVLDCKSYDAKFPTKAKYVRHWEERHEEFADKYQGM